MKAQFELYADHNAWTKERAYEAARALSDTDYRRDEKVFFKSIHGTLKHLLIADRIWLYRFAETAPSLDLVYFHNGRRKTDAK